MPAPPLVIGLTGGIGSGKSAATACFEALGVPVIDADRVARDVVAPGAPALRQVVDLLGPEVLAADGSLDRRAVRERVFNAPALRQALEAILHPVIRRRTSELLDGLDPTPYAILAIPLLVETGGHPRVHRILVVDCPEALQIERTTARDGTSAQAVRKIMDVQASRANRLAVADDVIVNDGDLEALRAQVQMLHERYKQSP
ncbi:MAG: dephospho-CoA kinase [Gammaproteobacteria bacterium]